MDQNNKGDADFEEYKKNSEPLGVFVSKLNQEKRVKRLIKLQKKSFIPLGVLLTGITTTQILYDTFSYNSELEEINSSLSEENESLTQELSEKSFQVSFMASRRKIDDLKGYQKVFYEDKINALTIRNKSLRNALNVKPIQSQRKTFCEQAFTTLETQDSNDSVSSSENFIKILEQCTPAGFSFNGEYFETPNGMKMYTISFNGEKSITFVDEGQLKLTPLKGKYEISPYETVSLCHNGKRINIKGKKLEYNEEVIKQSCFYRNKDFNQNSIIYVPTREGALEKMLINHSCTEFQYDDDTFISSKDFFQNLEYNTTQITLGNTELDNNTKQQYLQDINSLIRQLETSSCSTANTFSFFRNQYEKN